MDGEFWHVIRKLLVLWEGIPMGWDSSGKGFVPQGSVLGSGDSGQEVGVNWSEMAGGGMMVEKVSEIQLVRFLRAL